MSFGVAWSIWAIALLLLAVAIWFGFNGNQTLQIVFCFLAVGVNAVAVFSPKR